MICEICNKPYRYCSSLTLNRCEDTKICSYTCWEKTEKYINTCKRFKHFIKALNNKQLEDLNWLFEEVNLEIYNYSFQNMVLDKLGDKKES